MVPITQYRTIAMPAEMHEEPAKGSLWLTAVNGRDIPEGMQEWLRGPVAAGVATVREIRVHPLKSGAIAHLATARVRFQGLADDRLLMVATPNGGLLTARDHPRLLAVHCCIDGNEFVLLAPGMMPLTGAMPAGLGDTMQVVVWGTTVDAERIASADQWLTDYLSTTCRLVGHGPETRRRMMSTQDRPVSFADTSPLLLIGSASMADLSARVGSDVSIDRFRPNLVVATTSPYAEDQWRRIRIGTVEFDVIGPCNRCNMVLLDPDDPGRTPDGEPLATLSGFRRDASGQVCLGQLLVPRNEGRIHVGDTIEVLETVAAPAFVQSGPRPITLLDPLRLLPAPSRPQAMALRCVDRSDEGGGATTFRFARADGGGLPDYAPGQSLALTVRIDGGDHFRMYSLSSSPTRAGLLAITVKRDGFVSSALHDRMTAGDLVDATAPLGAFHLLARPASKLCLLSAGSGITPFLSMLRWTADLALPVDIVLNHSARRREDIIAHDELRALARQLGDRLRLMFRLTADGASRFTASDLTLICPDVCERAVFACGPPGFLEAVRDGAASIPGMDAANVLTETFAPAGARGSTQGDTTEHDIRFTRSNRSIRGTSDRSIAALARESGLEIPLSCEAGLCGTCRVTVTSGAWTLSPHCADPQRTILSAAEKADGVVLACTTRPVGTMEVDL